MASVSELTPPPAETPVPRAEERLVDEQIHRTRQALKWLDWTSGLLTLAIGSLLFLLTVTLFDHWVIPGGWNGPTRLGLFGVLLIGIGWYSWRTFWPLLSRPINPAYAAQLIERSSPSLKNSLLNFLLLRNRRQQLSQKVFQAIEQQAAQRLSEVSFDSVLDHSALLRLGYVLLIVVAVCGLYRVLSPKNITTSFERVLFPWSVIAAPSRVHILNVTPGDTSLARGESLEVAAEVAGIGPDEPVEVHFSTVDQQIVDRHVPLLATTGGSRHTGTIPDRFSGSENGGVQQDLEYWIVAGDAESPRYRVTVYSRPTLVVERLRYEFPDYTRLPMREVEGTGDINALEGTKVTITSQANYPIAQASVDFGADGKHELSMSCAGDKAQASFLLALQDDRHTPEHESYVLRYSTDTGRTNSQPPKFQIEVTPDYNPEIRLLAPADEDGKPVEQLDVALDQRFTISVEARDPDFALQNVTLLGNLAGKSTVQHELLGQEHAGRFVGEFSATPQELELKPGDLLEYWAVATDNRRPEANMAETARQRIRVVGRPQFNQQPPQQGEQQPGENGAQGEAGEGQDQEGTGQGEAGAGTGGEESDQQGEGGGEGESKSEPGESASADGNAQGAGDSKSDTAESQPGESQPGESASADGNQPSEGEQPSKVPPEGDDDPTAFDRISDHFAEKDANSKGSPSGEGQENEGQDSKDPGDAQEGTGEGEPDTDQTSGGESADNPQPGEKGENSDKPSDPSQSGADPQEQEGTEGEPKDSAPGESASADGKPPDQARGDKKSDSQGGQSGDQSGSKGQAGAGQQADSQGTGAAGENTPAEEGGGESGEPGEGENSNRPGTQGEADQPTGKSSGDKPGAGESASADGESNPQQSPAAQAGTQPPGGGTGNSDLTPPPAGENEPGDAANLEYARQQTDLVIERLEDQLDKRDVDAELLEKLGWSADELQQFVSRWKQLKADADSPEGTQKLDDALRSLGIDPQRRGGFRSATTKEKLRQLRDAYRAQTPLEYADQVRAYIKGTAVSEENTFKAK